MSRHKLKKPRRLRPGYKVPKVIHDRIVRRGKKEGYREAMRLPFWRRLRVAARIVVGETRRQREARLAADAAGVE